VLGLLARQDGLVLGHVPEPIHRRYVLADRGIERPSLAEYRGALADAYALVVKSRTS
jgi:hypothetical protein